ncbi:hypothetical protein BD414DRAFT_72000 [Trametes punicea]|nr:hypothetical protein BD414DRAFT_72000 [Trametes punicea]
MHRTFHYPPLAPLFRVSGFWFAVPPLASAAATAGSAGWNRLCFVLCLKHERSSRTLHLVESRTLLCTVPCLLGLSAFLLCLLLLFDEHYPPTPPSSPIPFHRAISCSLWSAIQLNPIPIAPTSTPLSHAHCAALRTLIGARAPRT